MGKRLGRYLVASILSGAVTLGSGAAAAQESPSHEHEEPAAQAGPSAVRSGRWSEPAAWPDGTLPSEGDAVTITRGTEVVLDVDPPALRNLTVDGKLTFADDRDVSLETDWIYLRGG